MFVQTQTTPKHIALNDHGHAQDNFEVGRQQTAPSEEVTTGFFRQHFRKVFCRSFRPLHPGTIGQQHGAATDQQFQR